MTASAASPKKIYVLVDRTVPSKRLPARSCLWDKVLGQNPPEKHSISDSREQLRANPDKEPVRIDFADIVIVNWDAANGDYACGSDDVYLYFLTRDDRRDALLAKGGILLCEFQSGKGVLHQGAYDVIFGDDEVTVYRAKLGPWKPPNDERQEGQEEDEAKSHGAEAKKYLYRNHPIVKRLPEVLKSAYKEEGDHLLNFSERFAEFHAYKHRESQLWRGWFENWKKGWVPLLVTVSLNEWSWFDRWFKLPPAVLLTKVEGKGLMLASTMWIAGARCQELVDQIMRPDIVKEIRRAHWWISFRRAAYDFVVLGLIMAAYGLLFWEQFYENPTAHTALGRLLAVVEQVGFVWLAIIALRFWKHFFWNRPYGVNVFQFFRFARKAFWETV